jgi:multidrug efflux pump subunit AcrB
MTVAAHPQQPAAAAQAPTPSDSALSDTASTAVPKKIKKVWTNEEVTGISSTISVVGDGHAGKSKSTSQTPADPQYIAKAKLELQKLQAQIVDANKQLAKLKSFSEGEPVGSGTQEFHKGYNNEPIEHQRVNLETKKTDLQAKIDALLDEARKKGVEPGQLRQ